MKKSFYQFIRITLGLYNHFYFRDFRVIGKENIPNNGAILFSPNHQNAFLDPLLVGTSCGKKLHSLTRSDVFGGPFQWVLDAMQMLPVYRIRDGYQQLKKNEAVFERCYALLKQKKHLMMFSEGKHHDQYYLQPLSKGSSRLAITAQIQCPDFPIYIQAVGLNYGHHLHARHNCVVVYGEALDVRNYIHDFNENPAKSINALRDDLQAAMENCLWLPKNNDQYVHRKEFINLRNTALPFKELKKQIEAAPQKLHAKKGPHWADQILIGILSLPNILPLWIIALIRRRFKDPVFHGSVNYLGGLVVFFLWWFLGSILFPTTFWVIFFGVSLISLLLRQFIIVKSL